MEYATQHEDRLENSESNAILLNVNINRNIPYYTFD